MKLTKEEQDRRNAEARKAIAEKQNREYREARLLALGRLGPGFKPWMKISLVDADFRRSGNTQPVAVIYKVRRKKPEAVVYLRMMPNGLVEQAESYEDLVADLLAEKHPTYTVEIRGQRVPVGRYEAHWAALEEYHPRSAEQLTKLRTTREKNKHQKWRKEFPLLAAIEDAEAAHDPFDQP